MITDSRDNQFPIIVFSFRIFVSVGDTVAGMLPWMFGAEMTLSLIDLIVVILLLIGVVHKRHKLVMLNTVTYYAFFYSTQFEKKNE